MHWRVLRWWSHREEGAAGELAGKRKRGNELAHQPVRHSLWEQDSLEAHNELLFGCLDGEVGALQQRKAVYGGERGLSGGSDPCWSYPGSGSGSEAELVVGMEPLALEGDGGLGELVKHDLRAALPGPDLVRNSTLKWSDVPQILLR